MKITFIEDYNTAHQCIYAGESVEVPDDKAKQLIEAGIARADKKRGGK